MLESDVPGGTKSLTVPRREIEIVLSEEGVHPFALVLPPVEDLSDIQSFRTAQTSITDEHQSELRNNEIAFREELAIAKAKLEKLSDSPVFLNRLANLAGAAGALDEEEEFLRLAHQMSPDAFFAHRVGDNLIAQMRNEEAKSLFSSLDLGEDLYANLRVAMFLVQEQQLAAALERVEKAIQIDPTSYSARLFEGGLCLAARDFGRAIHAFRIASEERPTSSVLYANWAVAYIGLGENQKALAFLRRAVALGPLNVNAVCLLADLAFEQRRNEDALPALRYFVQFEQKRADIWARLARACLQLGQFDEAILHLKREAALSESSGVWNNLGVAHRLRGDMARAQQAFKRAIDFSGDKRDSSVFVAARNMAQTLNEIGKPKEVDSFARSVLDQDDFGICLQDNAAADLYAFRLNALRKIGRWKEAESLALRILENSGASHMLLAWTIGFLVSNFALHKDQLQKAITLISNRKDLIRELLNEDAKKYHPFINNLAFALAEAGHTERAEEILAKISQAIHKEPYPTATLGLIHIRRGHVDKAIALYEEAVHLATKRWDKARIRQKLNLELGRFWAKADPTRARMMLEKAAGAREGEAGLIEAASRELESLKHGPSDSS
jgi:tetratricopeptide (TPR) repeat protein